MKETELIQIALMLTPPWNVVECQLDIYMKMINSLIHLHSSLISLDRDFYIRGCHKGTDNSLCIS